MQKRNTEPFLSTYFHAKGYKLGLPISGNFELTARCNFNCPMCYVHMGVDEVSKKGKELTAQQWIEIARDAKEKGMLFVLLTGGEPFIRKDFFEIYDAMKAMGLMISINSNGSMIKGNVLRHLLENPPFRINISLYGGCNETYEKMCGMPVFNEVLENIAILKENRIDIRLNLSITPYNCEDVAKIYRIAEKYNIPVKASSYMYPPIRLKKEIKGYGNRLSPNESAKYSVEWDRLRFTEEEFYIRAKSIKNLVAVETEECSVEMENGVGCRAGSTSFWMTWDGQMRPCGMMTGPTTFPLEISFDEAWKELREKTKQIQLPQKCSSCSRKKVCGVCAAVCAAETGKFDCAPQYMCQRTGAVIRETLKYIE